MAPLFVRGAALVGLVSVVLGSSSSDCDICASSRDEYCELFPKHKACGTKCGFEWDSESKKCYIQGTVPKTAEAIYARGDGKSAPIIGGSGKFRYQYMPDLLKAPEGAALVNCHGLSVDAAENIILTYQNDGKTDKHCLISWNPDGTGGAFATGDQENPDLCPGVPHGLKITTEETPQGVQQFLYHANNAQKLAKTTMSGEVVWIKEGYFGQNETCTNTTCPNNSCRCSNGKAPYIPTWFATPPNSKYMYLCDGYGSDHVYAFDRATGSFMNKTWGGRSPAGLKPGVQAARQQPHGLFMENHGCTYDPRPTTESNTIVVSDRRNMRFEFFHYDPDGYETFEWYKSVDMSPDSQLGAGTLPCNMRMTYGSKFDPAQEGRSIVPDLAGPVAVLDANHTVISVVNVSVLLAFDQQLHPHDALFLKNGDFVVATWAPGRVSYWKLIGPAPPLPDGACDVAGTWYGSAPNDPIFISTDGESINIDCPSVWGGATATMQANNTFVVYGGPCANGCEVSVSSSSLGTCSKISIEGGVWCKEDPTGSNPHGVC